MEQFFKDKKTLARLSQGCVAAHLRIFAMQLEAEGYSIEPACKMIKIVDEFGDWLKRKRIDVNQITVQDIERFLRCRARKRRLKFSDLPALKRLLSIVDMQRGIIAPAARNQSFADKLCNEFCSYLEKVRGLSLRSVSSYKYIVQKFLTQTLAEQPASSFELQATHVISFVTQQAGLVSPKRASLTICALRSFLRFARVNDYILSNLWAAVPNVPGRSLTTAPTQLTVKQVMNVLSSCNRATTGGRRDYAVLLLLARLGLRAGEVASLTLDDIDWKNASITVCGKTGRASKLPIPSDVGEALVDYLQSGRPETTSRAVFFRIKAPVTPLSIPASVSHIVERALRRARIESTRRGAHLFRHTLATEMLRQGATLPEIGEILRHRNPRTTMVYANVGLSSLRKLAGRWPGGDQ